LITFAEEYKDTFKLHDVYARGTTGKRIIEGMGLEVHRLKSGPLGGDQEIGSMVANGKSDLIIFFSDPLTEEPNDPDVSALRRLSDVYDVSLATNEGTASAVMHYLNHIDRG